MEFRVKFVVLSILCLAVAIELSEASYECGIRKHGFHSMISHGWQVEDGSWPWHVAVFHRNATGQFEYACGGTLVNEWHVLTAAHCVVKRKATKSLPAIMYEIELHFGQHNLSIADDVVIRDVKKAHVHPEYKTHKNDIAVLVMRLAVEYSEYVIPICLDRKVDRDLQVLEGHRGWVTGWGRTENGTISEVLQTLSLPVASHSKCLENDRPLYGSIIDENVFCAGNLNGTSPSQGDSGGGFFFSDGDRWVLRGIISTGKMYNLTEGIDPNKYIVFVNVQRYLTWIGEIFAESDPPRRRKQKRISEIECERFQTMAAKRRNGNCYNSRYPHHVMVVRPDGDLLGNGVLVNERNVLTTCSCIRADEAPRYHPAKVRIDGYADVAVWEMFCHPNNHDLAILKLSRLNITLRRDLIPACLANNWTENLYDSLQKTHYGRMVDHNITKFSESDNSEIASNDKCAKMKKQICPIMLCPKYSYLGDSVLCVRNRGHQDFSDADNFEQPMKGDVLQSSNKRSCMFTIVGLCSESYFVPPDTSRESNSDTMLGVYTRISHHLDWIEHAVWSEMYTAIDYICGEIDEHNVYPWSVAIYLWNFNASLFEFSCSGTLISMKHVLTTAQCAVNRTTGTPLQEDSFELHAGQKILNHPDVNEQIRFVSEVHVHPEYAVHDVGILVASWPFTITLNVSPICIDSSKNTEPWIFDDDLQIYMTRWVRAEFESGMDSEERVERVLTIGDHQLCSEVSQKLRGKPLDPNMHCSVFDPVDGDDEDDANSGLAVYAELLGNTTVGYPYYTVGIVSSIMEGNGTENYALYVNLKPYIAWIEGVVSLSEPYTQEKVQRISDKECDRFDSFSEKVDGACVNAEDLNHIVVLLDDENNSLCSGVLVKEDRVLSACECISGPHRPTKVKINSYGVVDILKMICHPDYNSTSYYHDFAVLQLVSPVELSSRLIPACLANNGTENIDMNVLFSAFVKRSGAENLQLRSKYDVIVANEHCCPADEVKHVFSPSQFCIIQTSWKYGHNFESYIDMIGMIDIDRTVGGIVVQSDNSLTCRFTLIGRGSNTTHGSCSYRLARMAIGHRVAYYLDWIEQVVWEEEFPLAPQQNWEFVAKDSSSAAGQRNNFVRKLLALFVVLTIIF